MLERGGDRKSQLRYATVKPPRLEDLGIEKTQSHRWPRIASIPEERFERHILDQFKGRIETTTEKVSLLCGLYFLSIQVGKRVGVDEVGNIIGIEFFPSSRAHRMKRIPTACNSLSLPADTTIAEACSGVIPLLRNAS